MPRSDFNSLALGTRLASGLGRACQKYVFVPYRELAYVINSTMGEETDDDDATTVMQAAVAATTGSTLCNTYGATGTMVSFPAEVTAAFQQLLANQTAMMQQFATFTVNNQPPSTRHNV